MTILGRVGLLLRTHKRGEEEAAFAVDVAWLAWRLVGAAVFGASIASAAVMATSGTPARTYHPSFSFSTKGAAMTARYEGLRLSPYNDPYNCTVGVGHLIHMGPCNSSDLVRWRISYAQAMTLLLHDSSSAASCVRNSLTHRIRQPQFDALVDLTFNAGCGSLFYSGIANEVNRGDLAAVPRTLRVTAVTASGHYLAGLATRRAGEAELFAHGFYGSGLGYYLPPKPAKPRCRRERRITGTEWPHRPRAAYTAKSWVCVR